MRYGRVGPRPVRQPGVLRAPDQYKQRRALIDLILELPGDPHPPGRHGFAVKDDDIDAATLHPGDDSRFCGALHVLDPRELGCWPVTDSQSDLLPRVAVVAIDEDRHLLCARHLGFLGRCPRAVGSSGMLPARLLTSAATGA